MTIFSHNLYLYNISIVIFFKYLFVKDRFPVCVYCFIKNIYINICFVSDKTITNQFQESLGLPLLQQNINELNLEESNSQCLKTASEQLKQHLNSNYGFSNLDEYNSYILPPRRKLETIECNTIPSIGGI